MNRVHQVSEIMVCSRISYLGVRSLAFLKGNMNSQKYTETLEKNLEPSVRNLFGSDHWIMQRSMHQFTSPHNLAQKRQHKVSILLWPAQLSESQSSWNCVVSATEQSQKLHVWNQHLGIYGTSCRLNGKNCLCGTSQNFLIQFHIRFAWCSVRTVTCHNIQNHHTD